MGIIFWIFSKFQQTSVLQSDVWNSSVIVSLSLSTLYVVPCRYRRDVHVMAWRIFVIFPELRDRMALRIIVLLKISIKLMLASKFDKEEPIN